MWSTPGTVRCNGLVTVKGIPCKSTLIPDAVSNSSEGMNELIAQLTGSALIGDVAGSGDDNDALNEENVEEELDMFEKILTQLLTVQSSTGSWSRNERLAYLHDMATQLDDIVEQRD